MTTKEKVSEDTELALNRLAEAQPKKMGTFSRLAESLVTNASLIRSQLISKLFDPRRDINTEAGYPNRAVTAEEYRTMYDQEGTARRVVWFWPDESWVMDPIVFETEDPSETPFEEALAELLKERHLYSFLSRIDGLSGIGRYGILLIATKDSLTLDQPVENVGDDGKLKEGPKPKETELLYLRTFSEESVQISHRNNEPTSPRFGQPELYTITLTDYGQNGEVITETSIRVHWSRVIHVAEGKEQSNTLGTPRQGPVWHRLLDYQKVMGGSGEMFWKGAFPGYSIETVPDMPDVDINETTMREQLQNYFNGLQRYLALTGVTVKSLTPQMADPTKHRDAIMDDLAFTLGVPKRKFVGSEQAQLASEQDARTWNGRVRRRNEKHVTPEILSPTIERLIAMGVLPVPADPLTYEWPDLNTATDQEKAEVALKRTEAMAKYVTSGVEALMPPAEFLTQVMGFDVDEVEQILEAAEELEKELEASRADEIAEQALSQPQPLPGQVPEEILEE